MCFEDDSEPYVYQYQKDKKRREELRRLITQEIENAYRNCPEFFEEFSYGDILAYVMEGLRLSGNDYDEDRAFELFDEILEDWL